MNLRQRTVLAGLGLAALALTFGGLLAQEGKVSLKVGDKIPAFTSVDDHGKPWKSEEHVGKKIVVLYFYPADLTGGCTKQACGFRDDFKILTEKGVEVVGVSGDSPKNHELFKSVHKLPFTLLADEKGELAKMLGVPFTPGEKTFDYKDENGKVHTLKRGVTTQRWTVVIGKDGKLLQKSAVKNAADDSKAILDLVK